MKKPKISVVMPAYNAQMYLSTAINSILNQSFRDFEYIIVNDGSTDATATILASFNDRRIKIITHKQNKGIVASLNAGIKQSQGTYIARMDADDIALSDRLERQYAYMQKHVGTVICASNIQSIDQHGNIISKPWWNESSESIKWSLIWGNVIPHPTVMIRKSALPEIVYRNYRYAEDYDLWLRMMSEGDIVRMKEVLVQYRIHEDHQGDSTISMEEAYRSNLEWIANNYQLNIPREHRWVSKFSQYGEDFGNISFEDALEWMEQISQKTNQLVSKKVMIKNALSACDKLVFSKKMVLLKKSLFNGYVYHSILISIQSMKQYIRMFLGMS
jgi:glycosyltransferase involved in cell wall biosynthesis